MTPGDRIGPAASGPTRSAAREAAGSEYDAAALDRRAPLGADALAELLRDTNPDTLGLAGLTLPQDISIGGSHRRKRSEGEMGLRGATAYGSTTYGHLRGDDLAEYDCREDFAAWVVRRAGLEWQLEEEQAWRVAGHRIDVTLWQDDAERFVLLIRRGWPPPDAPASLCLAEVVQAAVGGELPKRTAGRKSPELSRWKARALIEAGLYPRPPVSLAPLLARAPLSAGATWALVGDLLAARRVTEPGDDVTPLNIPFLLKWAGWLPQLDGLREGTVKSGRGWLARNRYLTDAGPVAPGPFGNPLKGWRVALLAETRGSVIA